MKKVISFLCISLTFIAGLPAMKQKVTANEVPRLLQLAGDALPIKNRILMAVVINNLDQNPHYAKRNGRNVLTQDLIDKIASYRNTLNNNLNEVLGLPITPGFAQAIVRLLNCGADINTMSDTRHLSPLTVAIFIQDTAWVELLLARGAQADLASSKGETALMLAAQIGNHNIAELLIAYGANTNACSTQKKLTPLILAAEYGHYAVAQLLLSYGANVHAQAENGATPLSIAHENSDADLEQLLMQYGTNVDQEKENRNINQ